MSEHHEDLKLFINVNPMVIHDKQFESGITSRYLKQYNLKLENIVFEVTEHSAVEDIKGFKDTIRHYKSQGYHIAVDDAGSCYSGLNLICDIVPHYLKLDGTYLIQRPFVLVTKKDSKLSDTAKKFFDYCLSEDAKEIITGAGVVPAN